MDTLYLRLSYLADTKIHEHKHVYRYIFLKHYNFEILYLKLMLNHGIFISYCCCDKLSQI